MGTRAQHQLLRLYGVLAVIDRIPTLLHWGSNCPISLCYKSCGVLFAHSKCMNGNKSRLSTALDEIGQRRGKPFVRRSIISKQNVKSECDINEASILVPFLHQHRLLKHNPVIIFR